MMKPTFAAFLFLVPLVACAASVKEPATDDTNGAAASQTTDGGPATGTSTKTSSTGTVTIDPGLADQLNGQIASGDYPPPSFVAQNYDLTERTEADLIGHPTVLWFYPLAKTPG
jgi:hypothetical protein